MGNITALRGKCAIVGIGESEYSKHSGMSEVALTFKAAKRAVDDAGLTVKDIDSVITIFGSGATPEDFSANFGIEDLKYTG